jgi:hypothetical protein
MHHSNNPKFKLNLGKLDERVRITTTTTTPPPDSAVAEFRSATVKRYKGYLHNSMIAGHTPFLANVDYRSRNIALRYLSPPSPRARRLLKTLPRLDTGRKRERGPLEPEEDYFSLGDGWQKMIKPKYRPPIRITPTLADAHKVILPADVVGYFDWYAVMREEAQRAQMATERYIAITQANRMRMGVAPNQDAADFYSAPCKFCVREAQFRRSLERERAILDNIINCMFNGEPNLVGLVPMYDEWRYRTAAHAIERAREERRSREEWAMGYAHLRCMVVQPGW